MGAPFATTRWSVVLAAGDGNHPGAQEALESLCATYWRPVYGFVRRSGYTAQEAEDLTQALFANLIERGHLAAADPDKGRFRSFLLIVAKRFLAKERERAGALKRGGGVAIEALDFAAAERWLAAPGVAGWTPEQIYRRSWALALLARVLELLAAEYRQKGKGELFEACRDYLTGDAGAQPYAQVAAALGTSEGALKVAVHRLRRRYRDLLREEVGHTIGSPGGVDEELVELMGALSGR